MPIILVRQRSLFLLEPDARIYADTRHARNAVLHEVMERQLSKDERLRPFFEALAGNFDVAINVWNSLQRELFPLSGVYYTITPAQIRPPPKVRQAQIRERARAALRRLNGGA